jgi:hypothetical protein
MIEWIEQNDDPAKKRYAGLRLLVKSIVDAEDRRIPHGQHEAAVEAFAQKDGKSNGRAIAAVLKLNGLGAARIADALKNASGEASTGASPSDSRPQPDA